MSDIIDWEAVDRDGMPAFKAALKALEMRCEFLQGEHINAVAQLYRTALRQDDRLDYLDARRKDDRKIREEIDARLRVIEEQVTNLAEALRGAQVELETLHRDVAELTHDTQTDLRILQERMEAPKLAARPCAVCHDKPTVIGQLCADCLADVTAGIEDAGLLGIPAPTAAELRGLGERAFPRKAAGPSIGHYCEACGTVVIYDGANYDPFACECGHNRLRAVTVLRDDTPRRGWPSLADISMLGGSEVRSALRGNGNGHE